MKKKASILVTLLLVSIALTACRNADIDLSDKGSSVASILNITEGTRLSDAEIKAVISEIPSDRYEAYPDTHGAPLSATLYKDGEMISIDVNDARLIALTNFFNQCVYYSKCAYTQGLLPWDYLEEHVTGADFRLELKYAPYGDVAPAAYGKCTTMCDTIVISGSGSGFILIAHDLPGYEGNEERYPFRALGVSPLYDGTYPWLEWFGF